MRLAPAPAPRAHTAALTPENRKKWEESLSTGFQPRAGPWLPCWSFRPSWEAQNRGARRGLLRPGLGFRQDAGGRPPPGPTQMALLLPRSPTCEGVGAGQVVPREVNEGAVLGVHELRLRGHVAGVLHGAGRGNDAHLHRRHTQQPERGPAADTRPTSSRDQHDSKGSLDPYCQADEMRTEKNRGSALRNRPNRLVCR